jgi:protein AATF/BFR2
VLSSSSTSNSSLAPAPSSACITSRSAPHRTVRLSSSVFSLSRLGGRRATPQRLPEAAPCHRTLLLLLNQTIMMRSATSSAKKRGRGKLLSRAERIAADVAAARMPADFDPEEADDLGDGTGAGGWAADLGEEAGESLAPVPRSSALRAAVDMSALGEAYAGQAVSGKKALKAYRGGASDDDDDDDDEEESGGDGEDDSSSEQDEDDEQAASSGADEESEEESSSRIKFARALTTHGGKGGAELDLEVARLQAEDKSSLRLLASSSKAEQALALQVQEQQQLWNAGLEVRVLLQKALDIANRLPIPSEMDAFCNGDAELRPILESLAGAAEEVAQDLDSSCRSQMLAVGLELGSGEDEYYETCKEWWLKTADHWHARVQRLNPALQKKFKVVNQGVSAQVSASLADPQRAKKKMCMPVEDARAMCWGGSRGSSSMTVDPEIYDDREFYQHLLRDFLESSGAGSGMLPVRSRGKRKRAVDTRASKGRKLRYEVHPKLTNYMAPIAYPAPPMDVDKLFDSLLGGISA